MKKLLRIGTRSSKLALWQANYVKDFLEKNFDNLEIELKKILTTGDKNLKDNIESFGGKSVFVKEIEESLLNDDIDLAVHSYKDLPVILPEGLEIISTSNSSRVLAKSTIPALSETLNKALLIFMALFFMS